MFSFAQNSNLVFYTPEEELFYVELNGVRQNDAPASFVRIKNYNAAECHAKIVFKNSTLGKPKKDLEYHTGKESVFVVKNAGMAYTINWERDMPLHMTTDTKEGHIEVNYKTPDGDVIEQPKTGKEYIESYTGQKGCETPMSSSEFRDFKNDVKGKGYDDGVLNATLKGLKKQCITANQCLELMKLLKDEELRMELVAFSYPSIFDQDEFDKVLGALKSDQERKIVKDQIGLK